MTAIEHISKQDIRCQRCKEESAILKARGEYHCKECYLRLVRGKQRKQMSSEKYKINYKKSTLGQLEKVLLAFSGGISSLVLLDVLGNLLLEQQQTHIGLQGFEIVVVNIDEKELSSLDKEVMSILPELLTRFKPVKISFKTVSLDSYVDLNSLKEIRIENDFTSLANAVDAQSCTFIDLLSRCPNKSSVEDLLTIVFEKLLLQAAYDEGCGTIVLGHSMTRIANEIIALTVKGRGSSIHRLISNRTENYNDKDIDIIYPLRDLLFAEIDEYAVLSDLKKYEVYSKVVKSRVSKNLTIRDLVSNYFTNLDVTGYSSTASTVMKIGQKLGSPESKPNTNCKVCGVEIYQDPKGWLKMITVNEPALIETEEERNYLEMYLSSVEHNPNRSFNGENIDLCYGCITTLNGVRGEDFVWPIEPELNLKYREASNEANKKQVLNEFVLTDTEDD
ncbi:Ncs2 protein [Candida orthopsilosis Co 90-125]|uniref:Cytoplasmic tRNA 2-thiolation protein 2 n=1 Tax=Candida orthopsilosis (strain 90-125) TaxID=1136231 RepID=H8WVY2_CANO9|nr:Ncs2 protein [Candida orthopsilosis Co 90-125]CCG20606.1 Ncs2 protein [Candida orthopsilosis Co 90-125]